MNAPIDGSDEYFPARVAGILDGPLAPCDRGSFLHGMVYRRRLSRLRRISFLGRPGVPG